MANVIKHKRGSGSDPSASDLVVGEVAIRTDVGKLFTKMDNGSVAEIAGGGSDIAINTLSSSSGTGGGSATFNGSAYRFTLSAPPSVSAQQLLVSINGVIQKPVAGTGQPSEGFSVDGTDIILGDAPATGSDFFILTFKSLGVSEPADNSVTSAKIVDGAIVNADINASAAIAGSKISPNFGSQNIVTTGEIKSNTLFESTSGNDLKLNAGSANRDIFLQVNDTTLMTVQGSTGSVGIGIASPSRGPLHVHNNSSSDCQIHLTNNDTGSTSGDGLTIFTDTDTSGIWSRENVDFQIATNGTERMRIDSAGHLLFGTTHKGLTDFGDKFTIADANAGMTLRVAATNQSSHIYFADGTSGDAQYRGYLQYHHNTDHMGFGTAATERMRIDSSGRVIVGSTSHIGGAQFVVMGGNINTYGAMAIGNKAANPTSGTAFANFRFNSGATGTRRGAEMAVHTDGNWTDGSSHPSRMTFSTTATNATGSTERMRIDSSGRLLLGTTTEGQSNADNLTIDGGDAETGITIRSGTSRGNHIYFSDGTSGDDEYRGIISYQHSDNKMQFFTNAAERMRIASNGRVGIGVTSPTSPLHISGGSDNTILQVVSTDARAFMTAIDNTGEGGFGQDGALTVITCDAGASVSDSAISFQIDGNSEKMRIDSSGRLLVGTTVEGHSTADDLTVATSGHTGISIRSGTSNNGNIYFSDGTSGNAELAGYIQYNHSNNSMLFGTNESNAMLIASGGQVYIGRTAPQNAEKFTVEGSGQVIFVTQSLNADHSSIQMLHKYATSSTNGTQINFLDSNGTSRGRIKNDNSTTQYLTSSDYRLKENEVLISDGITRLKTLKPYRFNWKQKQGVTVDGFFAHEVVSAVPESVDGEKDAVVTQAMVDAGTHDASKLDDPEYQQLDQSKLVPLLVAALQEAIGRIEALEAK